MKKTVLLCLLIGAVIFSGCGKDTVTDATDVTETMTEADTTMSDNIDLLVSTASWVRDDNFIELKFNSGHTGTATVTGVDAYFTWEMTESDTVCVELGGPVILEIHKTDDEVYLLSNDNGTFRFYPGE